MAVGTAQILASHAGSPQGVMVSEWSLRVVPGPATAEVRRVKPECRGTEPTNGDGASRRRGNVEMVQAVLAENPERVRRKPNSLGVSRVWGAMLDRFLPVPPRSGGTRIRYRESARGRLAKLLGPSRNPTSVSSGHLDDPGLPFHLSPGRETGPEASDPKGSARSPKGRRERQTGHPPQGVASARQRAIGSGLRAGTERNDTLQDGFGRMVRSERSKGRSHRRNLPLGAATAGPGTPRGGASFLGVSRVQWTARPFYYTQRHGMARRLPQ